MKRYSNFDSPEEFLHYVLDEWNEFCRINTGITKAISDLLEKYEKETKKEIEQ